MARRIWVDEPGSGPGAAVRPKGILTWLRSLLLLVPSFRAVLVIYADREAPGGQRAELVDNVFGFGTPPTRWMASTRRRIRVPVQTSPPFCWHSSPLISPLEEFNA